MAGGPYKGTGGTYYCTWSAKKKHPKQPKQTESLRTKKMKVAKKRLSILETLYDSNYHDPWTDPWHKNQQINHIVISGRLDLDSLSNDLKSVSGIAMEDLVEDYIAYKSKIRGRKGWSENRAQSVSYTLRQFLDFVGYNTHPDRLDEFDIQDFLYRPKVTSDHTRRSDLTRIKACFNWGIENGYTTNKITYEAEKPQEDIPAFLTRREIIDICGYQLRKNLSNINKGYTKEDNTSLWMIYGWLLMASTGLRPNELMNLKSKDVEPVIHVGRNRKTKVNKQRTVPHHRWTSDVLSVLLDEEVRKNDRWMKKRDWLFGRHGSQAQRHLSDHFREARKEIVPNKDITLYNLRDSFAVWYLTNEDELSGNQDRRLYELMRILGHAKLSTTQIYLKCIPLATQLE